HGNDEVFDAHFCAADGVIPLVEQHGVDLRFKASLPDSRPCDGDDDRQWQEGVLRHHAPWIQHDCMSVDLLAGAIGRNSSSSTGAPSSRMNATRTPAEGSVGAI